MTIWTVSSDNSSQPKPFVQQGVQDHDPTLLSPGRPIHSRSMSNPIPSLFSGKKRRDHGQPPPSPLPFELSEHGESSRRNIPSRSPGQGNTHDRRRKPVLGPHDFRTGHCMTCASLVRWPKDLHVFRCTICMTVNDIEPSRQGTGMGAHAYGDGETRTVDTISVAHTKHLITECLTSSLQLYAGGRGDSGNQAGTGGSDIPESSCGGASPWDISHRRTHTLDEEARENPMAPTSFRRPMADRGQPSFSTSYPGDTTSCSSRLAEPSTASAEVGENIFKRLEDYLMICFKSYSCISHSFTTSMGFQTSTNSESGRSHPARSEHFRSQSVSAPDLTELDPKLLMLGDFAENGSWWTGGQGVRSHQPKSTSKSHNRTKSSQNKPDSVSAATAATLGIDWSQVTEWYHTIVETPSHWRDVYDDLVSAQPHYKLSNAAQQHFENALGAAHHRLQRVFLKCIETLLKRPRTQISEPQHARFLAILMCNPLLTASAASSWESRSSYSKTSRRGPPPVDVQDSKSGPSRHSGIIKRILGIMANSSEICHRFLTLWFSGMPDNLFLQVKDLTSSFVTYRLTRQNEKVIEAKVNVIDSLVPQMSETTSRSNTASLHAALHGVNTGKTKSNEAKQSAYTDDWQIKAAARVMALIFAANEAVEVLDHTRKTRRGNGRPLPISDFYHSVVDTLDFKSDFELWESKRAKFTFCQYPFFLSIWAKIQILEHDAKRQMTGKAREAFFDSILSHRTYAQHLVLKIRRDCLVDDSLKKVSAIVGSGSEDIKKALRIEFDGEEGVDAGGLRKEWFLLLVREVFNPDHGLFIYDDDSQLCYFNPHSFETSDQYFLVGVVLGLAIYNSTILDIALPPFAFRKLLAAGPIQGNGGHPKPTMTYSLDDLAEFRPAVARGLQQLLDYDGDVQADFCLDFVVETERYGTRVRVPLCPGGETKMVTASNRREYVDLFVRYHLDTAVTRQFEPFKRGFFTVCGGNALSLFRAEEIELLVRGSAEPLDIASLQGAAEYSNWSKDFTPDTEPTVQWFWRSFAEATPPDQQRLLAFITGSDRIPATGAAALTIKVHCLGDDEGRFPSARTCFNMLSLYRCSSRQRLEDTLWRAVYESEGFGLK
ncbi:uncharacterized protein B0I36DRAFT_371206 [Microdochium trichocladiopsis]|uniref:HECT-type E3 ubiquitin transferase n=1 Tax=Microdochium trichocladiopsis TaxID=1682393 RepID=A0A9P8YIH6_9PEZI|nr:uncharacterized protein B0I36DRAFT_371206 [Microdochium trichocladiopsis]KAH7040643.1 hypothetical protein B0I36DRAFT_371206 [Microdochium trichocladiopsis]